MWVDFFTSRLIEDKYIVDLNSLFSAYSAAYDKKSFYRPTKPEDRNKFLYNYLLPILQRGELKVQMADQIKILVTEEDIKNNSLMADFEYKWQAINIHYYEKPEQSEDAITDIKEHWEECLKLDQSSLIAFEEWGVQFTLPENDWPQF
ncbi:MAG TPA: hypothetical protein PLQ36_00010 [Candidatus Gracilibacteria bacterium]|nr:hypothetical protein [Candidatus Gracilibacteria bacterium]